MNPPSDELDPSRLESASFEMVRRGFDPTAVRDELQRAAQELRRLRLERDELTGRLAELDGLPSGQLEPHQVAEALGIEAAQVIEAAHLAAKERSERAEREAEAVRDEALASADATRAEAQASRDSLLDEARREAETVSEEGRERGRDMVAEAQTVRERMLRDLARKRQTGRAQVEQLRAGRDRLLESLTIAQQSLDTAVADLLNSVPEARAAAERAGLRVSSEATPTPDELEGEIEAARLVGHPLVDDLVAPGVVDDTFDTGEMEALTHLDVLGDAAAVDDPEEVSDSDDAIDRAVDDTADTDSSAEDAPSGETAEDGSVDDEAVELYDLDAEDSTQAEPETAPDDEEEVDDVFARLRSSQLDDDEAADDDSLSTESSDDPTVAESEDEPAAAELESVVESPSGIDAERAAARTKASESAAKAMKKVLVEEQGTLLDGIRRSGADAVRFVLDDPAAHRATYEKAAAPALKDLAASLGGSRRVALSVAFTHIDSIALEPVRQRLSDVAERVDDPDELSDTVRALYRESRSRRVPEAAAAAAVAIDGLVSMAADGAVQWHVQPDGPCGPDCADNALAGALPSGDVFPTGDKHPPAHPACTCWLTAAPAD